MLYRFGEFEVDSAELCLSARGTPVALEPRTLELLLYLLEHPGRLVRKQELLSSVWQGSMVTDNALTRSIGLLRKALGDDTRQPKFIETVPKAGYRFIGEVHLKEILSPEPVESAAPEAASQPPEQTALPSRLRHIGLRWSVSICLAMLVLVFAILWTTHKGRVHEPVSASTAAITSLGVLPLANLSGDASQGYFADGMTEELTTELGRMRSVRVISRTSMAHYKDTSLTVPEIARELGVDALVEGSVARSNEKVRISVQLVRATTDQHIWAESYERPMQDVLQLENDVARTVAGRIQGQITAASAPVHRSVDPEAYELYLKGLYFLNKRTPDTRALEMFQASIAKDPTFAPAYAEEAGVYHLLSVFDVLPLEEARMEGHSAVQKALELDSNLAEAHAVLGLVDMHDWRWHEAEHEFLRAIELNPNYAPVHEWYGDYLIGMGRANEAVAQMEQAKAADPLSLPVNTAYAWSLEEAGRREESMAQFRRTEELDPNFAHLHEIWGTAYVRCGDLHKAESEFRKALELTPSDPTYVADLAFAYGMLGQRQRALSLLDQLRARSPAPHPDDIAVVYMGLSQPKDAMQWLEKAYEQHFSELIFLGVDPVFQPLHSEPHFLDLMHRTGIPLPPQT